MKNTLDDEIVAALQGIHNRLDTLASINTENILIPGGPQQHYHQIVEEAYSVLSKGVFSLSECLTPSEYHSSRLRRAPGRAWECCPAAEGR